MAGLEERPPDDWGNEMARRTFLWTMVLSVLYIGSVFAFILLR